VVKNERPQSQQPIRTPQYQIEEFSADLVIGLSGHPSQEPTGCSPNTSDISAILDQTQNDKVHVLPYNLP